VDPREEEDGDSLPYLLTLLASFIVAFILVAFLLLGGPHRSAAQTASVPSPPSPPSPPSSSKPATSVSAPIASGSAPAPVPKSSAPGKRRTYNVVLLTIDTLRADLGFAGYPRPVSPHLDELAKKSTVYERAYATASYTPKSMGPLLIGRYATETDRNGEHYTTFFPSNVFVAERAHDAGVRTIAGVCHRYFLWKKGFQEGQDIYDTSAAWPEPRDDDPRITSDRLSDAAIRLLGRPENSTPKTASGRFLAWFHYIDPHTPYVAHKAAPNFAGMPPAGAPSSRAAYDAEVWFTDSQVGRVVDFVRSQPWGSDTAIIVTADHGEAFGEHGHWRHGREVWESLIRVPLIISLPDDTTARRIPVKRSHIDVVPTILDLLGIDPPPRTFHGKSLLADMRVPLASLEERDVLVDMPKGPYNEARRAIVTGPSPGMKAIHFGGKSYDVYDLGADPNETHELPRSDPRTTSAIDALDKMVTTLAEVEVSN
jgi:arylsulfatase A-like enzyme